MNNFINLSRIVIIFIALSGFIFSQLYFNSFSIGYTLAAIFGILAAVLAGKPINAFNIKAHLVAIFSFLSIIGISIEAYNYYMFTSIPGNSFGWHLIAPYIICLLLISWTTINTHLTRRLN